MIVDLTLLLEACTARRVHPYSSDYYVVCERRGPHLEHALDGCTWRDDSRYALPPIGATS